ncbi:MAG: hypothetical protein V3V08_18920, partial [Nannocystaceae bacterium]
MLFLDNSGNAESGAETPVTDMSSVSRRRRGFGMLCPLCVTTAGCVAALLPLEASADAVLTPNQIGGVLELVSSNPDVARVLDANPASASYITATSVDISPRLWHYTRPRPDGAAHVSYQLTVESSAVGIAYDMQAMAYLHGGTDIYRFANQRTPGVLPEPAGDVEATFSECAGMVDVRWVDDAGHPHAVTGGRIMAFSDVLGNTAQADVFHIQSGSTSRPVAVHGDGSEYRLEIFYDAGTDPSRDKVRALCQERVLVACDEIVPVTCVIPSGSTALGSIAGSLDMLGEHEQPVGALTQLWAYGGPFGNYRYTKIASDPASGRFALTHLMPSAATATPTGYLLFARMIVGAGHDVEFFTPPWITDGRNGGRLQVEAGKQIELGELLVISTVESSRPHIGAHDTTFAYASRVDVGEKSLTHMVIQAPTET